MSSANAGRWIPLSGIVFVALFVVAFAITGDTPQPSDSDAEYLAYYGDSGNRKQEIAVFFMIVIGALFFLWFLTNLRERLRAVESGSHGLATHEMEPFCTPWAPAARTSETQRASR